MKRHAIFEQAWKAALFLGVGAVLTQAFIELERIGWGSGSWLWRLSLKWSVALAVFILLLLSNLVVIGLALWKPSGLRGMGKALITARERLGWLRWLLSGGVLAAPLGFLGWTYWGLMLTSPAMRFVILFWMTVGISFLLTRGSKAFEWRLVVTALILSGAGAAIARELANVTDYPFSLYWSEGNRFWDYSILFGRERYHYPADLPIKAYIELPRQFLWGLPFLFPGLDISGMRLWNALVYILPYMLLGWAAFRPAPRGWYWGLCGLWAYLFLGQGPIYTQLVVVAIVVALIWRRRWWIALPAFLLASYLAAISRFTWSIAPLLWMAMLLVGNAAILVEKLWQKKSVRLAILCFALGAVLLVTWKFSFLYGLVVNRLTQQPLLWQRLFPNPTYPNGILLGTALAAGPVLFLTIYLLWRKKWSMNQVQKWIVFGLLAIAFAAGLVVSVKIGGGADLHNMDIFLLSVLFLGLLAWENGASEAALGLDTQPATVKVGFLLLVLIPAFQQMQAIEPLVRESDQLARSTLILLGKDDSRLLPSRLETERVLNEIREQVARAQEEGEVLFMDQRQLLTFGAMPDVPLVVEYEKKLVIDLALGADEAYFAQFYSDLASRRFALIVSEPLRTRQELTERVTWSFLEEDDIWTDWVAEPVLCYYEPISTYEAVRVQLLVPRQEPLDCPSP